MKQIARFLSNQTVWGLKPHLLPRAGFGVLLLGLLSALPVLATMPAGVIEIERQLNEWRMKSAGWVELVAQRYPSDSDQLSSLHANYIEASSIANSLIDQLQTQITSRSSIDPRTYEQNVKRAKDATEALVTEGKRLLEKAPKGRGSSITYGALAENAAKTVSLAGGILDVLTKNKKAFLDVKAKEHEDLKKLLEQRRWKTFNEIVPPGKKAP